MTIKDIFDISGKINKRDRVANLSIRMFGVDFDAALYGYINDWSFPVMFVPGLRGVFVQSLFLALFIGRMKERP